MDFGFRGRRLKRGFKEGLEGSLRGPSRHLSSLPSIKSDVHSAVAW